MKMAKACRECRSSKRKCSRIDTSGPCVQCSKRALSCSSTLRKIKDPQLAPRDLELVVEQETQQSLDIHDDIVIELIEHYIDKLHDRPHSLFHLPTLRERVRRKTIKKALLLAICSLGARFSKNIEIRSLEPELMATAKRLTLVDLENICLENIQTCILLANLCAANSKSSSEALFFRIAIGMAQILRLPSFEPRDTIVNQELKRRVWWTLFMADRWYSSGLGLPRQIHGIERTIELPMDESIFHSILADTIALEVPWKPGLWAHMITLVDIFGPIQDLNRRIVQEDLNDVEISKCTYDLSQRLDAWEDMLPADKKFTQKNLEEHRERNTGGPFVALHLGFHHYSTLLYFQYLETKFIPTTTDTDFANRCKHHASSYSSLLRYSREHHGFKAVYPTVGHMAIVSSSVLLHTLLFGDEYQLPSVRASLNSNFEALIELEQYWPALKSMTKRLVVFQNTCLLAKQPTHKLNKWMIRFLIEHALPIDETILDLTSTTTTYELQIISAETQKLSQQGRFTSFNSSGLPGLNFL